jgi:hypothetical protein
MPNTTAQRHMQVCASVPKNLRKLECKLHEIRLPHNLGAQGDMHNPSVVEHEGQLLINVRVLYKGSQTENFLGLVCTDNKDKWTIDEARQLASEIHGPNLRGFEDLRLFMCKGVLSASATIHTGGNNSVLMAVLEIKGGSISSVSVQPSTRNEKNWMPLAEGGDLRFVYSASPLLVLKYDWGSRRVAPSAESVPQSAGLIRGSSQVIPFSFKEEVAAPKTATVPTAPEAAKLRVASEEKEISGESLAADRLGEEYGGEYGGELDPAPAPAPVPAPAPAPAPPRIPGYLAVVHQVCHGVGTDPGHNPLMSTFWAPMIRTTPSQPLTVYVHRFIRFNRELTECWLGRPFYFVEQGIEFCAGLTPWQQKLVLSFGVKDKRGFLAEVDASLLDDETWERVQSLEEVRAEEARVAAAAAAALAPKRPYPAPPSIDRWPWRRD